MLCHFNAFSSLRWRRLGLALKDFRYDSDFKLLETWHSSSSSQTILRSWTCSQMRTSQAPNLSFMVQLHRFRPISVLWGRNHWQIWTCLRCEDNQQWWHQCTVASGLSRAWRWTVFSILKEEFRLPHRLHWSSQKWKACRIWLAPVSWW